MSQEVKLNEYSFLVSETDEKGIIRYANEDFCKIAEYDVSELIGKNHNIVRHEDMPKIAFKTVWDTLKKGEIWEGFVKNKTKSGKYYWVYATIFPFINNKNEKGYLSCRRMANEKEILKYEKIYKELLLNEKK